MTQLCFEIPEHRILPGQRIDHASVSEALRNAVWMDDASARTTLCSNSGRKLAASLHLSLSARALGRLLAAEVSAS